jgi:hypothetical protein
MMPFLARYDQTGYLHGKGFGFSYKVFWNLYDAIAIRYIQYYSVILVVSDKTNKSDNYPNEEKFDRTKRQDNYNYF